MSENFELAVATVRAYRFADPHKCDENFKNGLIATSLQRSGVWCKENTSGRGADILGEDFVAEGKNDLLLRSVLYTLKSQIDDYVRQSNLQILVVIYGDASRALLGELKSFTSDFYTADIRVVVMGKVVNSGPANVHPSATTNSMSKWFNL